MILRIYHRQQEVAFQIFVLFLAFMNGFVLLTVNLSKIVNKPHLSDLNQIFPFLSGVVVIVVVLILFLLLLFAVVLWVKKFALLSFKKDIVKTLELLTEK